MDQQRVLLRAGLFVVLAAIVPACGGGGGGGPVADSVQFSAATYTVLETAGSVTITVTRTGGPGAVSVNYATSDGTATTAAGDYTAASGTLSWVAGDATPKTFNVTIAATAAITGDITVNLTLSLVLGGALLGTPSTAVIVIQDLSTPADGAFQFSAATYTVSEGQVTVQATITVTRTGGSTGAVSAAVTVTAGTAAAGTDYTAPVPNPVILNWLDTDATPKTFTIDVLHNAAAGAPVKTVNLALSIPAQPGVPVVGRVGTAVLNIVDNDVPGLVKFSATTYSVFESAVQATITVSRYDGTGGVGTVQVNVTPGTAVAGTDYVVPVPNPVLLTWADGDIADKTFTIGVIDNTIIDGTRTVNLALQSPGGVALGAPNTATLNILDDEPGNVVFSSATYSILEGNAGTSMLAITVNRLGGSAGAASVQVVDLLTGSATVGVDYVAFSPATLIWANGDSSPKSFNITVNGDTIFEPDETINLQLQNPMGVSIGLQSTATATILNDDLPTAGTIQFGTSVPANYTVSEVPQPSSITINVSRVGGSLGAISVTVNTSNGTARSNGSPANRDFVAVTGLVLNWANGDIADKQFSVTINHNLFVEPTEFFNVTLSAPTGGATISGTNPIRVTIIDGNP